ncbi:HTH marR-type domain-containing protein [Frankia sp. Hr75.2]|nr:HTH marR-type domain-containing protein [Frankia sp. Hr75.2]
MFLMAWVSHALTARHAADLAELSISPRAYCVLVKALMGELTQTQLGDQCNIDKTTMVVTLDELERSGLAERRPSSTDRRARIVVVTRAGEKVVAKANKISHQIQEDVLGGIPVPDRQIFLRVLAELAAEGRPSTPSECERRTRRHAANMVPNGIVPNGTIC